MADVRRVSCGRDFKCVPDLAAALDVASKGGFDFICAPIVHPRYLREFVQPAGERNGAFTRADMVLSGSDWSSLVVGRISPWLELDSPNDVMRKNSEQALHQELSYAVHLSMPAVLMQLKSYNCVNLAQNISNILSHGHIQQLWFHIPMRAPEDTLDKNLFESEQLDEMRDKKERDPWEWWNLLRTFCANSRKLGVALELPTTLPSDAEIQRWCGEPVKAAIIPTGIFLTNKKGFPVLPKAHQALVRRLFRLNVQLILSGSNRHPDKSPGCYYQYLEHLYQTQPELDNVSQFAKGYEDYLQCPLQPLMDNLESQTYEIFERDPVKYSEYQKAVYLALVDRVPQEKIESTVTVIMVVGAGRGPLVRASLRAAQEAGRRVRVYAVEKNPNAIVTLETLKKEEWGDKVTVVSCDMREWEASEKADILVSELLGSFGDNELSPECLDGAQRFLKDDGVSIPCEYSSYVAPLCSPKLHFEVSQSRDINKGPRAPFETSYVVRFHNVHVLAKEQPCFKFTHPNRDKKIDNSRYKILDFDIETSSMLHGFAGYFDAVLYGDARISIVPETHSEGMFSWFPLYFPIEHPLYVPKDSRLTVHMWRKCTTRKVWYEWCVSRPAPVPIHNVDGRSSYIGL